MGWLRIGASPKKRHRTHWMLGTEIGLKVSIER